MKVAIFFLTGIVAVSLLWSCGQSRQQMDFLKQASSVYQEARTVQSELDSLIGELAQTSASIQVQGRALSDNELKLVESISKISDRFDKANSSFQQASEQPGKTAEGELLDPKEFLQQQQDFLDTFQAIQKDALVLSGRAGAVG